jgi:hypothetical protein
MISFRAIILMSAAAILVACSDNTEHELAACKLKAMDTWPEEISSSK